MFIEIFNLFYIFLNFKTLSLFILVIKNQTQYQLQNSNVYNSKWSTKFLKSQKSWIEKVKNEKTLDENLVDTIITS